MNEILDGIDLSDKVCVVTGASSGLGRESARALATAGAHVVLAARNSDALRDTDEWIHEGTDGARTTTVHLDLASLASVRAAATTIAELVPAVHVLMNNAGVMFTPFSRTEDGFEMQFGTNHLGHFELARMLLPQLGPPTAPALSTCRPRGIGSVTSTTGRPELGTSRLRQVPRIRGRENRQVCTPSNSIAVGSRRSGMRAFAVHPGMVATRLARHMKARRRRAVAALPSNARCLGNGTVSKLGGS